MEMLPDFRPSSEGELAEAIAAAARSGDRLALMGGSSKAMIGRTVEAKRVHMTGLAGIVDYDPAELVLTVRPGTLLSEVERLIAGQDQMLAFEPYDHGPIFDQSQGRATIGGVIAAGVAGSQRLSSGGARDHLLGFRAVSGRGEVFVAGAKVVKNVTGYDLPKLAAGSWGRLFALTELTLKVLPRPRVRTTWAIEGLTAERAVAAMTSAMASQAEIAAAAHVPDRRRGRSLTALRVQGFGPSVTARGSMVRDRLCSFGLFEKLDDKTADRFWADIAGGDCLKRDDPLWRVSVPPSSGPGIIRALGDLVTDWLFDWAGGLVWLASSGDPEKIRNAALCAGGHAQLVRAPAEIRAQVPALQPLAPGVAVLEERIRRAFDPQGVFEIGRF